MEKIDCVCPFCGCLCDDLRITIQGDRITRVENGCPVAKKNFTSISNPPINPRIFKKDVPLEVALKKCIFLLQKARFPLIYGLSGTTCQTAELAIILAEKLKGVIDHSSSFWLFPFLAATKNWGEQTCSLGEVKNLGDLVIFWRANPLASYPRLIQKFISPLFSKKKLNRMERKKILTFDSRKTSTAGVSDMFVKIDSDIEIEIFDFLRGAVSGKPPTTPTIGRLSRDELIKISNLMKTCKYGTLFFDKKLITLKDGPKKIEALLLLIKELNIFTKFQIMPLDEELNFRGSDELFISQRLPFNSSSFFGGFLGACNWRASGIDLLTEGVCDTALIVCPGNLGKNQENSLKKARKPLILIDWKSSPLMDLATVFLPVAPPGVCTGGTIIRMDGVPIYLKKILNSHYPTDYEVLKWIIEGKSND